MTMKAKKRKIPKAQRSRKNFSAEGSVSVIDKISEQNFQQKMRKHELEVKEFLATPQTLSMSFELDTMHNKIKAFYDEHGFSMTVPNDGIHVPEHVVIEAYNQHDLIIAYKMQLVQCRDWVIGIDTHFYHEGKDKILTVPQQFTLEQMTYAEVFMGAKVVLQRKGGFKTRWKGVYAEINDLYLDEVPPGYLKARTEIKIMGECYFNSMDAYHEFQLMKYLAEQGELISTLFEMAIAQQEKGQMDEHFQPKNPNETAIPKGAFNALVAKMKDAA